MYDHIQFIMTYSAEYVTSYLIKQFMKDDKVDFLDIIFSQFKFYDNDFILQLLLYYKNKKPIFTSNLEQQISNKQFKISLNDFDFNYFSIKDNSKKIYR